MKANVSYFEARKRASFLIKGRDLDPLVADYLMLRRHKWTPTELLMHYQMPMPVDELIQYQRDVRNYLKGMPPQYIIGTAPFFGMDLLVNPDVLIPRVETEELVEWVLSEYDQHPLKVLDLGTGSGAIALALKQHRPQWSITAADISAAALKVAKANSEQQGLEIDLMLSDLFNQIDGEKFDLIVSNPPYIGKNELKYMNRDVIEHEPHLALFAEHNGLWMYQRIANYLGTHHFKHQALFVEIGFHQGQRVKQIFADALPDASVTLKKDLTGNDRMIKVQY